MTKNSPTPPTAAPSLDWACPPWCCEGVDDPTWGRGEYEQSHWHRRTLRDGRVTVVLEQFVTSFAFGISYETREDEPWIHLTYDSLHLEGRALPHVVIGADRAHDVEVITRLLDQARGYLALTWGTVA